MVVLTTNGTSVDDMGSEDQAQSCSSQETKSSDFSVSSSLPSFNEFIESVTNTSDSSEVNS